MSMNLSPQNVKASVWQCGISVFSRNQLHLYFASLHCMDTKLGLLFGVFPSLSHVEKPGDLDRELEGSQH